MPTPLSTSQMPERSVGQDLLNVPMGDLIREMALAIAEAQVKLDEASCRVAEMMSGRMVLRGVDGELIDGQGNESTVPHTVDSRAYFGYHQDSDGNYVADELSMLELGFTPNFYQFIDTLIEVKIAVKMTFESTAQRTTKGTSRGLDSAYGRGRGRYRVSTTTVDASYSSKYSYSAEGSSVLRTKLVPVPPPSILEERIRALLAQEKASLTGPQEGEGG